MPSGEGCKTERWRVEEAVERGLETLTSTQNNDRVNEKEGEKITMHVFP